MLDRANLVALMKQVAKADPSAPVDLDGDNDTDASEFDQLTPIRFSVTVSDWVVNDPATSNITIK